ncbi:hypothetical protein BHE74_00052037 [Ensete ventricosum]|nr:hypothetical protein BHE74_00052037 [Ensete ventricosum]
MVPVAAQSVEQTRGKAFSRDEGNNGLYHSSQSLDLLCEIKKCFWQDDRVPRKPHPTHTPWRREPYVIKRPLILACRSSKRIENCNVLLGLFHVVPRFVRNQMRDCIVPYILERSWHKGPPERLISNYLAPGL